MDYTQQDPQPPAAVGEAAPASPSGASETDAVISGIVRTGPWARFIAVMGYIGAGFMCLCGLIIMVAGGSMDSMGLGMGFGFALGLFYLALAAVYLIPVVPLSRFASEASRLKANPSLAIAASAIEQSRAFWTRFGILCLVGLALVPVAIIVSIFVALANR
jgi:hypothetical protein